MLFESSIVLQRCVLQLTEHAAAIVNGLFEYLSGVSMGARAAAGVHGEKRGTAIENDLFNRFFLNSVVLKSTKFSDSCSASDGAERIE